MVENLQETASRSMRWWDSFTGRLDLPVEQLLISYMTRAGKVSIDRLASFAPEVVRQGLAQYAGCPVSAVPDEERVSWVLGRPLEAPGRLWQARTITVGGQALWVDVPGSWGPAADALIMRARSARETSAGLARDARQDSGGPGREPVVLAAPGSLSSVLTLFEVAERLRREAGLPGGRPRRPPVAGTRCGGARQRPG